MFIDEVCATSVWWTNSSPTRRMPPSLCICDTPSVPLLLFPDEEESDARTCRSELTGTQDVYSWLPSCPVGYFEWISAPLPIASPTPSRLPMQLLRGGRGAPVTSTFAELGVVGLRIAVFMTCLVRNRADG